MQSMLNFLESVREKDVIILIHSLPDLDAVGSSTALSSLFKKSKVVAPDPPTAKARKLLGLVKGEVAVGGELNGEVLLVLDTNSYDMLGELAESVRNFHGAKAVIDHHSIHPDSIEAEHLLIDNTYSSTSELVYEMLKLMKREVSERDAAALVCGMMDDSANFRNATRRTFVYVAELLGKTKVEYSELLRVVEADIDASQKIALLTACQRAELVRVGDYIIVKSVVGSYEAKAAEGLLNIGADVSFVGCKGRREARISARMKGYMQTRFGISLSQVMERVGKTLNGSGGGHACAAGANGPKLDAFEDAMDECVKAVRELLEERMNAEARV